MEGREGDIYFFIQPVFEVLRTTGISPVSPGLTGVFGQPLRTVQPHPAFTEFINNDVLPLFLKIKVYSTLEPSATVSKSNISF